MPRFFILRQGFWYKAWALSGAREGARCAIIQISCKVLFMSEGHEEPKRGADEVESLLPIDEHVEEGHYPWLILH